LCLVFFIFNAAAPTELYTRSLHDALPIWAARTSLRSVNESTTSSRTTIARSRTADAGAVRKRSLTRRMVRASSPPRSSQGSKSRSEEHTSELQSPYDLVCRLLLEKKKKKT